MDILLGVLIIVVKKPGDKVQWDGKEYVVIAFGPRNEIDLVPGVNLLGNVIIIMTETGETVLYEWDLD